MIKVALLPAVKRQKSVRTGSSGETSGIDERAGIINAGVYEQSVGARNAISAGSFVRGGAAALIGVGTISGAFICQAATGGR